MCNIVVNKIYEFKIEMKTKVDIKIAGEANGWKPKSLKIKKTIKNISKLYCFLKYFQPVCGVE